LVAGIAPEILGTAYGRPPEFNDLATRSFACFLKERGYTQSPYNGNDNNTCMRFEKLFNHIKDY
jgi:hypothetical protein